MVVFVHFISGHQSLNFKTKREIYKIEGVSNVKLKLLIHIFFLHQKGGDCEEDIHHLPM